MELTYKNRDDKPDYLKRKNILTKIKANVPEKIKISRANIV